METKMAEKLDLDRSAVEKLDSRRVAEELVFGKVIEKLDFPGIGLLRSWIEEKPSCGEGKVKWLRSWILGKLLRSCILGKWLRSWISMESCH